MIFYYVILKYEIPQNDQTCYIPVCLFFSQIFSLAWILLCIFVSYSQLATNINLFSHSFLQLLEIIIGTSCFYGNSIKVKLAKQGIGLVCKRVRKNSKLDE